MKRLALAAALLALAALPVWAGGTFYINIASQILLYAVFALGINILVGYAGLVSLGHAGLLGIAAYGAARILSAGHGHVAAVAGAHGGSGISGARRPRDTGHRTRADPHTRNRRVCAWRRVSPRRRPC